MVIIMKFNRIISFIAAAFLAVNTNAAAFDTSIDDSFLMLINDDYMLNHECQHELTDITIFMPANKRGIMLNVTAASELKRMYNDMMAEGLWPVAISGYRNRAYQTRLFNREVATQKNTGLDASYLTATPDTSEHQIGLAVDISNNAALSVDFEQTNEGKWLAKNCWRYGYILRYAKNKTPKTRKNYEPWHFRYVGHPHAEYMSAYNLVLEEYIAKLHTYGYIEMKSRLDNKNYKIICTDDTSLEFENIVSISNDNAGRYIITTVVGESEKPEPSNKPAKTETPKPTIDEQINYSKNKLILWKRNFQIKLQDTAVYIQNIAVPKTEQCLTDLKNGTESFINEILQMFA